MKVLSPNLQALSWMKILNEFWILINYRDRNEQ